MLYEKFKDTATEKNKNLDGLDSQSDLSSTSPTKKLTYREKKRDGKCSC